MLSYHIHAPDTSGTPDPGKVHVSKSTLWQGPCHGPNTRRHRAFWLASFQHAEKMMPRARQNQSRGWLEVSNTRGSQRAMCQELATLGERARRHLTPPSTCRAERPAARLSASPKGPQSKMRSTPSVQEVLRQVGSYEEERKSLAWALEGGWARGWLWVMWKPGCQKLDWDPPTHSTQLPKQTHFLFLEAQMPIYI